MPIRSWLRRSSRNNLKLHDVHTFDEVVLDGFSSAYARVWAEGQCYGYAEVSSKSLVNELDPRISLGATRCPLKSLLVVTTEIF